MRPGRPDIAAPDLPADISWVGDPPRSMPQMTASGPALVHIFDFAQLNSVRAMPYLREWHRRYAGAGLSMIGVQAPRFPFGAEPDAVGAGLRRLEVSYPVAIDAEREIWFDYGCEGWPSQFLWGRGGVLRWYHFGEGDYAATEEAIQEELREIDALRELPALMVPVRAADVADAAVMPPTPELFPAGEGRPLALGEGRDGLEVQYEAGGAYATIEGKGEIAVAVDGEPADRFRIEGAGLYELALHRRHESHRLKIDWVSGELRIWTVSFAAGVP